MRKLCRPRAVLRKPLTLGPIRPRVSGGSRSARRRLWPSARPGSPGGTAAPGSPGGTAARAEVPPKGDCGCLLLNGGGPAGVNGPGAHLPTVSRQVGYRICRIVCRVSARGSAAVGNRGHAGSVLVVGLAGPGQRLSKEADLTGAGLGVRRGAAPVARPCRAASRRGQPGTPRSPGTHASSPASRATSTASHDTPPPPRSVDTAPEGRLIERFFGYVTADLLQRSDTPQRASP